MKLKKKLVPFSWRRRHRLANYPWVQTSSTSVPSLTRFSVTAPAKGNTPLTRSLSLCRSSANRVILSVIETYELTRKGSRVCVLFAVVVVVISNLRAGNSQSLAATAVEP